jgi:alkylhydroperoxidase/carboxymuconolactone decarboxylase family protein YurZ
MENKNRVNFKQLHQALTTRILKGDGVAPAIQRQAALDNANLSEPLMSLIDKVAKYAYKVTDKDIESVKASGVTEDQIFELVICAAVGQASRQFGSALAALKEVTNK